MAAMICWANPVSFRQSHCAFRKDLRETHGLNLQEICENVWAFWSFWRFLHLLESVSYRFH